MIVLQIHFCKKIQGFLKHLSNHVMSTINNDKLSKMNASQIMQYQVELLQSYDNKCKPTTLVMIVLVGCLISLALSA